MEPTQCVSTPAQLKAAAQYYQRHHEEIMRRLALRRIEQGRKPRQSTLERYSIKV
jgi:hypothetical protein